jgi:uroporphyrinogen-III decarboxylase
MTHNAIQDDLAQIAKGDSPSRVPFFCLSQEFDAAYYGVDYETYLSSADTMVAAQMKAREALDYDWVWYQLHDCLEFTALGLESRGEGNVLPGLESHLPISERTAAALRIPDFTAQPDIRIFLDALATSKAQVRDQALVVGRIAAPFTSTVLLYGIEETMMALFESDAVIRRTTDFFYDLQLAFARLQRENGADAVWLGDCLASSKVISLAMHRDFAFDANRALVSALHTEGLQVIYEPADDRVNYMGTYAETGIDAINVGIDLDMTTACRELSGRMGLLGNLDAITFLQKGTPDQVYRETARIVAAGKAAGGYAFCTDSIPRDVPLENMKAMAQAVRDHGRLDDAGPQAQSAVESKAG